MNRTHIPGILAMAAVVVASNILVQFLFGQWLTWGAFTYPIAFLVTELVELAMRLDPAGRMRISVKAQGDDRALVTVLSSGLHDTPDMKAYMNERYGRVLTGLSRQLRQPLDHDGDAGRFTIAITIVP